MQQHMSELVITSKEDLEKITSEVTKLIDEDCAWAESSPMPEPEQAAFGVYDNSLVPPAFRPPILES